MYSAEHGGRYTECGHWLPVSTCTAGPVQRKKDEGKEKRKFFFQDRIGSAWLKISYHILNK